MIIFIYIFYIRTRTGSIGFSIIFPQNPLQKQQHSLDSNKQVQDRRGWGYSLAPFPNVKWLSILVASILGLYLFSLLPLNVAAENTVENAPPIECIESPIENRVMMIDLFLLRAPPNCISTKHIRLQTKSKHQCYM